MRIDTSSMDTFRRRRIRAGAVGARWAWAKPMALALAAGEFVQEAAEDVGGAGRRLLDDPLGLRLPPAREEFGSGAG